MTLRTRAERRGQGYLHWLLPVMLGFVAVSVLLSGRDLSQNFADLATGGGGGGPHPILPWLQRVVSVLLVLISIERLYHHVHEHRHLPAPVLTWTFVGYWAATVAAPALFGAHRHVSHEYLYSLVIGGAALVASHSDWDRTLRAVRSALFAFLVASALLAAVLPSMVVDMNYRQGLLPGVPRFGGLAPHPVALGLIAQTFLLCLWVRPFESRWLNAFAWLLGLAALFFAQSKNAWIAFLLCVIVMLAVRHAAAIWRRMGDPREGAFGVTVCLGVIVLVAGIVGLLVVADLGSEAVDFVDRPEGAQLMSMTGRDRIWIIAMEEWRASPVFGYGLTLWDDDFRASIGMPNATNAHNQFMDTLARSGVVGAAALVVYAGVLMVASFRAAAATGGLSLALFVALALRAVSEVPLHVMGYGTELFAHLLLIITVAAGSHVRVEIVPDTPGPRRYRTAT